jgi:hypothetical protein
MKVLIVEDELKMAGLIRRGLRADGVRRCTTQRRWRLPRYSKITTIARAKANATGSRVAILAGHRAGLPHAEQSLREPCRFLTAEDSAAGPLNAAERVCGGRI